MSNNALVNNYDHAGVKIITERAARYGDDIMQSMVFPFEFRNVQACYPILFQQDQAGDFLPLALFGFREGENLFLGERGWQAPYLPAMVRREPFLIGYGKPAGGEGGPELTRVLSIDMDHPRVNTERGEPLFQPLGGRAPFLENMADLLEAIWHGIESNKVFVGALRKHDLLESMTVEIELKNGSRNQLLGFHCLDEEKIQGLSGEALGELNADGHLMPIFMALASMGNLQALVELKNARLDEGDQWGGDG